MSRPTSADRAFYEVYGNGKNFMTPRVIRRGSTGNLFYELSSGKGFSGEKIYGVTVVRYNPALDRCERATEYCNAHPSERSAEHAIDVLRLQQ